MIKESKIKKITEPSKGDVVHFSGWGKTNKKEIYPCDVLITSGEFYSEGRLSNFWHWIIINPDGSLGKKDSGYGDFQKAKNFKVPKINKFLKIKR